MKYIIALLFLLVSTNAKAEYFFKYGLGLNNPFPDTSTKLMSIGMNDSLYSFIDYQLETGVLVDNSQIQGAVGFIGPSIGLRTKTTEGLYAGFFVGPALITQPDSRLASIFEFNNDFELGIKDPRGVGIAVDYKHFSNAGLTQGNIGRDFFTVKLTLPF